MKHIHLVCAARPNFIKIAPLWHALKHLEWVETKIVHTGQHYDKYMSDGILKDFELPKPHILLGIGSGTHAEQTGKTLIAYEKEILKERPDLVIVVGDVNATVAATLAAVKIGVKVAHLEAGLRSFDRDMPEELNRVITDSMADILWTPSIDADQNLMKEGVCGKIIRVGNIMIDAFEMMKSKISSCDLSHFNGLINGKYCLVTLHRPSNVDDIDCIKYILNRLIEISKILPLVFPVHPRTMKMINKYNLNSLLRESKNIFLVQPLSYIPFMNLLYNAKMIITDSGGVQEESTYLGIPCFTLRNNTERPVTLTMGTNILCKADELDKLVNNAMNGDVSTPQSIELWDGNTAARVVESITDYLSD